MKRLVFFIVFVCAFFVAPSVVNAQTLYKVDFNEMPEYPDEWPTFASTTTVFENATLTVGFHNGNSYWSEWDTKRVKTGTALQMYRTQNNLNFHRTVWETASTTNDVYLSFWLYIPKNDRAIDSGLLSFSYVSTYASVLGTSQSNYFQLCVSENDTFSLKQGYNTNVVNSCGNENYSARTYGGEIGTWNRLDFRLQDDTGYICTRINTGNWGACVATLADKGFRGLQIRESTLHGVLDYAEDANDYDFVTLDDVVLTTADIYGYQTISENSWVMINKPCYATSYDKPYNECGLYPYEAGSKVDLTVYIDDDDLPAKVEVITYYLSNDWQWVLEPYGNASWTYTTGGTKYIIEDFMLTVPLSTTTTPIYKTVACIIPPTDSVYFGGEAGQCAVVQWCNGSSDIECGVDLRAKGLGGYTEDVNPDGKTLWEEKGCEEAGLFEIRKNVECAMIWAFAPNDTVTLKWAQVKTHMLSIWPIGYGTLIFTDFESAINSTSTEFFDNDINIGRWFGRPTVENATVTISVAHATSEMGKFDNLIDWIEKIMWILFVVWVFGWAVTRKL